jgi:CBS domain-containing protein
MKVGDLMTREVRTCVDTDSINDAARIMWERDCGCVPVVEGAGTVVGMITDRDICMAAYTRGERLAQMNVGSVASRHVVTVREDEGLQRAEELMRDAQVRRLPVVESGGRLIGILSISDLARRSDGRIDGVTKHLVGALAGVSRPQGSENASPPPSDLRSELRKSLALLQTLRDEIRVRVHLGSLEIKDQWHRLEPHLGDVEKKAEEFTEHSRAAVVEAVKKLESLRSSLMQHHN